MTDWIKILGLWFRLRKLSWKLARQQAGNVLLRKEIQERRDYLSRLTGESL